MNQDSLSHLVGRIAVLMEKYEQQIQTNQALQAATTQRLDQAVNDSRKASAAIATEAAQVLQGQQRDAMAQLMQQFQQEIAQFSRFGRMLQRRVLGTVLLSLAALVGGAAYLLLHYKTEIADNQVRAELLKLYNRADVLPCGGRLCARIDAAGKKYGPRGEYRQVQDR